MNEQDREQWKSDVLDRIFEAIAASEKLRGWLIFKGARVLQRLIKHERQSLDIDSNLSQQFVVIYPKREDQRKALEDEIKKAVGKAFQRAKPIRYEIERVKVEASHKQSHPLGWDAFMVRLNVNDLSLTVRGLPVLVIDVAAPEELGENSLTRLEIGGNFVTAYALHRGAGEKLRAFLSSLPTYRSKLNRPGDAVRVKDLYDLVKIHDHSPLTDRSFWIDVGQEFRQACSSRFIDCLGLSTFKENWDTTKAAYDANPHLKYVPFTQAESTLVEIVAFLEREDFLPFENPLPE